MANGFFLGGMADATQNANTLQLKRDALTQETANQNAQLAVEKQKLGASQQGVLLKQANDAADGLMKTIADTASAFKSAGHTAEETQQAVGPMVQQLQHLYTTVGRDPAPALAQVQALVGTPATPSTADQQNYQFYSQQERGAGREPASFADYTANVKKAGSSNTTVNLGGETAFAKTLGEGEAKELSSRRQGALDAVKSLQSTDQARTLLDSGVITGTGADWLLSAGKALQQIGFHGADDAIANTESFAAQRAQETATIVKNFGAGSGLSDADREYALQAAAGKITLGEQSIRKILDINARASRNVLKAFNVDASKVDPHIVPFDLRVPEPPERAAQPVTKTVGGKTFYQQNGKWFDAPQGAQ